MDAARQIQVAVVRTDMAICAAWGFLRAALPLFGLLLVAGLAIAFCVGRGDSDAGD